MVLTLRTLKTIQSVEGKAGSQTLAKLGLMPIRGRWITIIF